MTSKNLPRASDLIQNVLDSAKADGAGHGVIYQAVTTALVALSADISQRVADKVLSTVRISASAGLASLADQQKILEELEAALRKNFSDVQPEPEPESCMAPAPKKTKKPEPSTQEDLTQGQEL